MGDNQMPDEDRATQVSPALLGGVKQVVSENAMSDDGADLTIGLTRLPPSAPEGVAPCSLLIRG